MDLHCLMFRRNLEKTYPSTLSMTHEDLFSSAKSQEINVNSYILDKDQEEVKKEGKMEDLEMI